MFGYIRPFKPYLRICEFDTYKAVYCGLCKELGKSCGLVSRLTLSYDFTFLGILSLAVTDTDITFSRQNCIAHPFTKSPCVLCGNGLDYAAAAAAISIFHKLRDDIADKGFFKKIFCRMLLPFMKKGYKSAKIRYPKLAEVAETNMILQAKLERENCKKIDLAAEPTAQIMAEIAGGISQNSEQNAVLRRLGYLLGRFIYITDALDDVRDDYKKGAYNPLLLQDGCENLNMENIRKIATDSINFTLGEIANAYLALKLEKYKPILENIVYLGLKDTFELVLNEKELLK